MSEEQELEKTETTEDVEGHHHGAKKHGAAGPLGAGRYSAEDTELSDEDDVEGHGHHRLKQ